MSSILYLMILIYGCLLHQILLYNLKKLLSNFLVKFLKIQLNLNHIILLYYLLNYEIPLK